MSDWLLLGLDTVYAVRLGTGGEQTVVRVQPTSELYRTARELYGGAAELTFRTGEAAPYTGELFFGRMDVDAESLGHMTVELRKVLYRERLARREGLRYLLFGDDQLFLWHLPGSFEQGLRVRFSGWESPALGVDEVVAVEVEGRGSEVGGRLLPGEQVAAMGAELMVVAEVYLRE
ncbi:hypothetical protein PV682_21880 [Streptomyces niveiscabiei]|uniref:hypothetical protein n=1 Tax=Streptomyces niveiscabiei TaxID=164115 RepID=UPI0029AB0F32|nr:hypothetical protein [Streptomyces niveiscabiei]MDX3384088.1 hypothetical protein [Streptomyces niveiscabiei]